MKHWNQGYKVLHIKKSNTNIKGSSYYILYTPCVSQLVLSIMIFFCSYCIRQGFDGFLACLLYRSQNCKWIIAQERGNRQWTGREVTLNNSITQIAYDPIFCKLNLLTIYFGGINLLKWHHAVSRLHGYNYELIGKV